MLALILAQNPLVSDGKILESLAIMPIDPKSLHNGRYRPLSSAVNNFGDLRTRPKAEIA
jgi:hypothetical protein